MIKSTKNLTAVFLFGTLFLLAACQNNEPPGNQTQQTQTQQTTQGQQPDTRQIPPQTQSSQTSRDVVKTCTTDMATQFHIHEHLAILIDGKPVNIPANIGIDVQKNCMSPIHTHDPGGIIHVESPVQIDFTLSDFFYNWGIPFDKTGFADYKVDSTHGLKFYVNGKESQDFENLILQDTQEITIIYYELDKGPGQLPPAYPWPTHAA